MIRTVVIGVVVLALAALTAMTLAREPVRVAAATTCQTKHYPKNTHCCHGCNGSSICVRDGAPCPECAPI